MFCFCLDPPPSHRHPLLIRVPGDGSQRSMKSSWPWEQHTSKSRPSDGHITDRKRRSRTIKSIFVTIEGPSQIFDPIT
ncbi:hypothetical protein GQ457_12G010990 [Hibiscus cannabinus]